jgi:hypothetical protein
MFTREKEGERRACALGEEEEKEGMDLIIRAEIGGEIKINVCVLNVELASVALPPSKHSSSLIRICSCYFLAFHFASLQAFFAVYLQFIPVHGWSYIVIVILNVYGVKGKCQHNTGSHEGAGVEGGTPDVDGRGGEGED